MLPYNSIMPRAVVDYVELSHLLIRPVKVSHCGKPSIVDRVGEDGSSPLLVRFMLLLFVWLTGRFAKTSCRYRLLP